jgi:hypothetical protein
MTPLLRALLIACVVGIILLLLEVVCRWGFMNQCF